MVYKLGMKSKIRILSIFAVMRSIIIFSNEVACFEIGIPLTIFSSNAKRVLHPEMQLY